MLGVAARAVEAQRFGLDVTGQNIANVNTPGYARRLALLSEVAPPDVFTAGGGVQIDGVRAQRSSLVDHRLWGELPTEQREAALAEILNGIELGLGQAGASIDNRLGEFFDAFARLAGAPTSSVARQEVVSQGESLAVTFNDMADRFVSNQQDADDRIRAAVDDINTLAARIASLNVGAATTAADSGERLHIDDELRLAVADLAKIASIETIQRSDGAIDISVAGRALVVGGHAMDLSVASRPVTGFADVVTADGTVITNHIASGTIAGLVHARDTLVPSYQTTLDELAFSVVAQVNAIHSAGYDGAGANGQPFFTPLASTSGAAAAMTMNPALRAVGGETLVVASNDATAVGDNGAARGLAALRDTRVLSGGTATFGDYWSRLVYRVGRDSQAAQDTRRDRAELVRQVESLRDSASGVSLDEEAANLMRFQRAYEANARFFQTVDDTLTTLMAMVGG